jgi:hypothetical protein
MQHPQEPSQRSPSPLQDSLAKKTSGDQPPVRSIVIQMEPEGAFQLQRVNEAQAYDRGCYRSKDDLQELVLKQEVRAL